MSRIPFLAIGLCLAGTTMALAAVEPRFLCEPVRPGDTAVRVAARLVRRERSWREPTFQIFDPIGARFIPKTQYNRIRPGWQACVVESSRADVTQPSPASIAATPPSPARAAKLPTTAGFRSDSTLFRYAWLSLTLVCFGAASTVLIVEQSWRRRLAISRALEDFGMAFVREFERPLGSDRSGKAAVMARLNLYPRRRALDVLVAPTAERRYPNLVDHRANVEYDVYRILSTLDDRRFACGPLEARGSWVAIPLRMVTGLHKEGTA